MTFDIGQSGVHGAAWQWMASAILTAFSLEAFVNHVGADLFSDWSKTERRESVRRKLDRLAGALGVDLGPDHERPLSSISSLVEFRNELAHGRTALLTAVHIDIELEDVDRLLVEGAPRTDWEIKVRSPNFAALMRSDVEEVLRRIHQALPDDKEPLFFTGVHMSGATAVRQAE